jgi:hypothetical protein
MKPGRIIFGLLILAIGIGWFLQAADYVTEFPWQWILPSILIVIGLALIVEPRSQSRGGLIALGIIITIVLMSGSVGRSTVIPTGVGDRTVTVTDVADLEDISMFAGNLVVDLRNLDLPEGTTTLNISIFAGDVKVYAPTTGIVEVKASSFVGEISAFGETRSGVGANLNTTSSGSGGTLVLKTSSFAGQIGVSR